MKVMVVVTHLLGTGHLARALTLARAFQGAGDSVIVVSGGFPVPHLDRGDVRIVQLPSVRSDGVNFSKLLTDGDARATNAILLQRKLLLLDTLRNECPDALITELYPFGRRILRDEFSALLDAAHNMPKRPVICASIRDILAPPSKPRKAHAIITSQYDNVLVHSVRELMPLDLSWPVTSELQRRLIYTGFVAPTAPTPHPQNAGAGEILISAGGGNVGLSIFACALELAPKLPHLTFRILVGGTQTDATCEKLNQHAPANFLAEPARSDFRQMLNHAAASVSFCGYNTALDILQTGCPAVFLPFDAGNEVEQSIRARSLMRQNGIMVLDNATLTPKILDGAIADVLAAPARAPVTTGMDGARQTQRIVMDRVAARQ
jgi:predicted glycosyltransferase